MLKRTFICVITLLLSVSLMFAVESQIKTQVIAITPSGNVFSLSPDAHNPSVAPTYEAPDSRQDDSLWYGTLTYFNAIGLTAGGTFEFAIRLTPTELGPFTGWNISGIKFYKNTGNLNNVVKVYDNGTPTQPGGMITSEPYASSAPDEWVTVMLSSPVPISGSGDLWCSVEVTHNAGEYPAGADPGPAVPGKGFWVYLNGVWDELQNISAFDYNWMIIAYLTSGGMQEPDIEVIPDTLEFILTDSKGSREEILYPSPLGRQIDTLIYDDGSPDAGYYWGAGARMASRMSPAQPCTILTLQYYCWSIGGNETIDATIYDWTGSAPGSQIGSSVSLPMDAAQQWRDADFSSQNLAVSGDFIASFNMNNDQTVLGFDTADNGRAWDYDGSSWSQWIETYFIRAIVDYGGGAAADTDTVQIMMINNVGSEDLIVDSIIAADAWIVSIVPSSFTVPPGNGQNVTVTVTRDALPNGVHYSSLAIWSNDPDENPYIEPVKFTLNLIAVEETETPVSESPYGVKIFPNPMSTSGTILYSIPSKTDVKINIYDIAGRLVRRLVNGEVNAGSHTAIWDRKDANGVEVTQGVYIYNFITPGYKSTGKITVIR